MSDKIVQLKSLKTLDGIQKSVGGRGLNPAIYRQKLKDRKADGTYEGDYREGTFMGSKQFTPPIWNSPKSQWFWGGTADELGALISKMNLRYEKGPKKGQLIEVGDPESRLIDRLDPVFNHTTFFKNFYLSDGRGSLNLTDPKSKFIYFCNRADKKVHDKTDPNTKKLSKARRSSAIIEMSSISSQNIEDKNVVDREVHAIKLLAAIENNEKKMRVICEVLRVPGYNKRTTNSGGLFLLLYNQCARNLDNHPALKKPWQEAFIEMCEKDPAELDFLHKIKMGLSKGILVKRGNYYHFKGERLDFSTEGQLIEFFKATANQDRYLDLLDSLEV